MRGRTAALLGALALILAGCGSSGAPRSSATGTGRQASSSTRPGSSTASAAVSGRVVFTRDCSFCHSLSGHSSPKQQGGDLLDADLRRPVLTQFTAEMPVKHRLSTAELNAVVDYVLAVQRGAGRG